MTTALKFDPPVIGHRGACAYAPENTLASFTKAMQLGVKWVEFDVMQSADGVPVIFHDDLLDRTTNGHGALSAYPYAYLSSLDAGAWFDPIFSSERIPTLLSVVEFLQNANMFANIEIKPAPGQEERLVKRVMKEMAPYLARTRNKFLFSSFSMETLYLLRKHAPDCLLGMLLHEWQPDWQEICKKLHCTSVHVNQEILTEQEAHHIKGMHKTLLCYTVNDAERARELFSMGVDAVFSDAPDKIAIVRNALILPEQLTVD